MFVNVDGALSSLSTCKDGSQVVVAGRNGEFLSDSNSEMQICIHFKVVLVYCQKVTFWIFCVIVFKVIGVEESGFVEKTNLRVGRINLNFCITDVQWHPVDGIQKSMYFLYTNNKRVNRFGV